MSCHVIKMPDGTRAIVCGPRERRHRCGWCDSPAQYQCDAPTRKGTCSRYLCGTHAVHLTDGRDVCPNHLHLTNQGALAL